MSGFNTLYILWIVFLTCNNPVLSDGPAANNRCNGEFASTISTQMKSLQTKIDEIQESLEAKAAQPSPEEVWIGNQSTFGSFRRLSNDAKRKLVSFELTDMEDLDVSTLIEELRPCNNLGSIKLHRVELNGQFPNSSAGRVTLPKLYEFKLILDSYPNLGDKEILSNVIFFKKDSNEQDEFEVKKLINLKTDIHIQFKGFTKFVIDHEFGEIVLDVGSYNSEIVKAINPDIFRLKRLTVRSSSLNVSQSQIPTDLSHLNLKYVYLEEQLRPTTEYIDFVKNLRRLKSLHIDTHFDPDFGAVINMSELPYYIQAISFRQLTLNMTDKPLLSSLESILLDACQIDDRIIESVERSFYNLKKIALLFDWGSRSAVQCHPFLFNLGCTAKSSSRTYLQKLDSIFVTRCERGFSDGFKPQHYDRVEEFLTSLGLGKSKNFLLEKKVSGDGWIWTGKNVTMEDEKLIKYQFSDWHKLNTWELYKL